MSTVNPVPSGDAGASFREWLQRIGLGHCADTLLEQGIDFDVASALTEEHLRACGVLRLGDRLRILKEIQLRTETTTSSPEAADERDVVQKRGRASAGERRQLTVMFCDLVDFTGLTQRFDGEVLNRMIDEYRDVCARVVTHYDGYVAQRLGDGLMVYFGWPNAHEDDAERCVRAALDIFQAIKGVAFAEPLAVHVGIATGQVVVGSMSGEALAEDSLAVGETPNLASRLQELAGAGEILIAPATLRLVGERFHVSDAGVHPLKGIVTPVQAWRVDAVRDNPWRFRAAHPDMKLTALIGRDVEVELLHRRWNWACNGEGQVALLCGEPGIGKSRLTQALRDRIREDSSTALLYQCSSFRRNSVLYPIMQQLEFAAGFTRDDSPEQKLDKLEGVLVGSDAERAETAGLFAALLSLPTDRYAMPTLSPQRLKEKLLDALTGQVAALSRTHPVLIVFEDAHWVDPTTQELLDLLVPRLRTLRVMLVVTHRPQYSAQWSGYPHVSRIDLTSLPPHLGTELVSQVALGKELPAGVLQQIVARADGVPLFIEELTKSVLESQLLEEQSDRYTLLDTHRALVIPTTLSGSLIERLGRRASVRELAQIGACIGREFPYDLLAAVSPYAGNEFDGELEQLTATGLVFRRGAPPDAVYTFKHALVQDAAYDSLLNSKRAHLHREIARALQTRFPDRAEREPEVLAHHLTQAREYAAAIPSWRRAGEVALSRVALEEAVAYLEKGLEMLGGIEDPVERDRFELSLREPLHAARLRWHGWAAPDVRANATAILHLSERSDHHAGLLTGVFGHWISAITQGRLVEAAEWATRLLDEGDRTRDLDLQILGNRAMVSTQFYLGNLQAADRAAKTALSLYDPQRARRWMELTGSDVRTAVGVFWSQCLWVMGYPDRAVEVSDRKDAEALQIDNAFDSGWAMTWGAYVFDYRKEPERLKERVAAAERIGLEQRIPTLGRALVPISRALASLRTEPTTDGIALLERGIAGWNASGGHLHEPYMKAALAEAYGRRGELDTALRIIGEALDQIDRPGWQEAVWRPEVLRMKAWLLMERGDNGDAERLLRESLECAGQQQARSWELRSATLLAELLAARGDAAEGYRVLAPVYDWFTEGFDSHDLQAARTVMTSLGPSPSGVADAASRVRRVDPAVRSRV
jgi:class 3 adenylate cyclase/tetratricopeptide (TPR) repeat protein